MAPTVSHTTKADMLAAFPETPPKMIGKPDLREIIRVMYHLMECSQSHESAASPLGLLFACLPQAIWGAYSQDPYPADPADPGLVANVPQNATPVEASNFKGQWDFVKKVHTDFNTMNSALIDRFLTFMDLAYKQDFMNTRVTNPRVQFRDCLAYFLQRYGNTNETERAKNKELMKIPWALQDGWERPQKQIDDSTIYAIFSGHPIPDSDIVDAAITLIIQTGLFSTQYEQWHERADDKKHGLTSKSFGRRQILQLSVFHYPCLQSIPLVHCTQGFQIHPLTHNQH